MTVYIDQVRAKISLSGEELLVTWDGGEQKLPLVKLVLIAICGGASVTSDALIRLLSQNTSLHFLGRHGDWFGQLTSPGAGLVTRRRSQFLLSEEAALIIAKEIVSAKIQNQRKVVRLLARHRRMPDLGYKILDPPKTVDGLDVLMGFEGQAAKEYWKVVATQIPATWGFTGRSGRNAQDSFNAMLNFLYALLRIRIDASVRLSGLEPEVGILHANRPGKPSLVLDLMEPFRPILADRVALRISGMRLVDPLSFEQDGQGVYMPPEARKVVVKEMLMAFKRKGPMYDGFEDEYERLMDRQAENLAESLIDEEKRFEAVRF